jgi:hypothetical protein
MSIWASLRMLVAVTVPASKATVTSCTRDSSVAMRRHVWAVARSVARMSSSASQHSSTWAWMRWGEAVKHRAQLEGGLEVAEPPLGLEQL